MQFGTVRVFAPTGWWLHSKLRGKIRHEFWLQLGSGCIPDSGFSLQTGVVSPFRTPGQQGLARVFTPIGGHSIPTPGKIRSGFLLQAGVTPFWTPGVISSGFSFRSGVDAIPNSGENPARVFRPTSAYRRCGGAAAA